MYFTVTIREAADEIGYLNTITHQPSPIIDSFNDTELLNLGTMQNSSLINGIILFTT